jgi:putative Holliday junction resolvase
MFKKVIALDVGSVRIGVAGSDSLGITAQALETWTRKGLERDLTHFAEIADARAAEAFVLGLPRNMDGSEGQQAADTRAFGEALANHTGLPVLYVDERLTSLGAHQALYQGGVKSRDHKKVVDKVAAVLILQTYMSSPARFEG